MCDRFTDRARTFTQLANKEAQRFKHQYIATEDIFLGLVSEATSVAANVLQTTRKLLLLAFLLFNQ